MVPRTKFRLDFRGFCVASSVAAHRLGSRVGVHSGFQNSPDSFTSNFAEFIFRSGDTTDVYIDKDTKVHVGNDYDNNVISRIERRIKFMVIM